MSYELRSYVCSLAVAVISVGGALAQGDASVSASFSVGESTSFDDGGDISVNEFLFRTPLYRPLQYSENLSVIPLLSYRSHDFDFGENVGLDDISAHEFSLGAMFLYQSDARWGGVAQLAVGAASDFHDVSSDAFFVSGFAAVSYRWSDNVTWYIGARSGRSSGENRVFPILGMQWRSSDSFSVNLTGPKVSATWQVSDDWRFQLSLWSSGGLWQLEQEDLEYELAYRSLKVAVVTEHRVTEDLWLSISVGMALDNHLDLDLDNGVDFFDDGIEDHAFIELGTRYVF